MAQHRQRDQKNDERVVRRTDRRLSNLAHPSHLYDPEPLLHCKAGKVSGALNERLRTRTS